MRTRSRRTVVIGFMGAIVVGLASFAYVTGSDPRMALCPVKGNPVLASFEIPQARAYTQYIPRMLRSPELETEAPAYVVLFDGPARLLVAGSVPREGSTEAEIVSTDEYFDGVVCVVVDGQATVYIDVDITSWRRP